MIIHQKHFLIYIIKLKFCYKTVRRPTRIAFTAPQHFTSINSALESLFGEGTKIAQSDRVFGSGRQAGADGYSFLLLAWIEAKQAAADYWELFAKQLAKMHLALTMDFVPGGTYGFLQDNFIGAGPQKNDARLQRPPRSV